MKKHILITCALWVELKSAKSLIRQLNYKNFDVKFLNIWVWVYNTIYSIKDYLSKNKVDFLVNFWVCWSVENASKDYFQVYRIKKLSDNKEILTPIYIDFLSLKSILCSDKIITKENELLDEQYVDMESFWIDFICEKEWVPFIIIKKPFDVVSNESKKVNLLDLQKSLLDFDFYTLFKKIDLFLNENKKLDLDIEFWFLKRRCSFQEFEQIKKDINKRLSLWSKIEDIKQYYKKQI